MNENQSPPDLLMKIVLLIVVGLIIVNLYTGATIQKIGIPGIFEVSFNPESSTVEPSANEKLNDEQKNVAPQEQNEPIKQASSEEPGYEPVKSNNDLSGVYLEDNDPGKTIVITHMDGSNGYTIEKAFDWHGSITSMPLGSMLSGLGKYINNPAFFSINAIQQKDGAINARYTFQIDLNGAFAGGRTEDHIWYPSS